MRLRAIWIMVGFVFASGNSRAQDFQCKSPPYGDTQQNYDALLNTYSRAAQSLPQQTQMYFMGQMQGATEIACEVKFKGRERSTFSKLGISDHEIDTDSSTALANAWFAARSKAVASGSLPKQPWDAIQNPPWNERFVPQPAPTPSPEVQQQLKCMDVVFAQPAISDLLTTLGIFQSRLTPVQLFNEAHASAKDSGAAQAFLDGMVACGIHPTEQIVKIWRGFAAGIFTYGITSILLQKAIAQGLQQTATPQ